MNTLLTIAIPTYNRSQYLELCLGQIFKQISREEAVVEVLVSDNCSPDDTAGVIRGYVKKGMNLRYVRNSENIGADRNFVQCFTLAEGKYVLILGDDDVLLDGALDMIITLLKFGDYGLVYLNSYGFTCNHLSEQPPPSRSGAIVYTDRGALLERINYWITFASGNIVNKSLFDSSFEADEFVGTNLVQLKWILTAILSARQHVVIEDFMVAFKSANTGGYKLCQVFGTNMNLIFKSFIRQGADRKLFDVINSRTVETFFPNLIIIQKRNAGGFDFEVEDYFRELRKSFGRYPSFWLVTVPVILLPVKPASLWIKICNKVLELIRKQTSRNNVGRVEN